MADAVGFGVLVAGAEGGGPAGGERSIAAAGFATHTDEGVQ